MQKHSRSAGDGYFFLAEINTVADLLSGGTTSWVPEVQVAVTSSRKGRMRVRVPSVASVAVAQLAEQLVTAAVLLSGTP